MLKSLLVPQVLGRIERHALRTGCALAREHAASVTALIGLSATSPMMGGWEYFPSGMYDTMDETSKAAAGALAQDVRDLLAAENVPHEVRTAGAFWLTPAEQSILHARIADLVVMGRGESPQDPEKRLFASILLGSGRPVMVVPGPERDASTGIARVVVAWKPTRESARALHDSMPFLHRAESIDLLMIESYQNEESRIEAMEADVLHYLGQHGLSAAPVRRPKGDVSTGQAILAFAKEVGADMIVSGGYGHARATEQVFGGVTRALFEHSEIPVLFSH